MSVEDQIKQLGEARKLVLADAKLYPQILQGVIPIIGKDARVELRRWGADFLAETFASPSLPASQKEALSLSVLSVLRFMIENIKEDPGVVKSVVQTAASIYPLVLKWIINNSYDNETWDQMTAIKSRIFRIWDTAPPGIRMCCIKFAQRVVLCQTNGIDSDIRRANPLDISLAMVPTNHRLIPPRNLEAEASGLLDRMLGVLHEMTSDAVLVDATLNSLSILIRARPPIASKILNAILSFNPLKLANSPMTPKLRVMVKSMEKTTRLLLININKRDPHNPMAIRIHQHVERLMRSRMEIFEEATRKRGPPESMDGMDSAKRQRLGAEVTLTPSSRLFIPPLTPGSHTVGELFTLSTDEGLKKFDVASLDENLVIRIAATILSTVDSNILNQAINGVRDRYQSLGAAQTQISQLDPNTAPLGVDDDDDDYEPDFQVAEDTEQILNKLDNAPSEEPYISPTEVALGPFILPSPPPLTTEEAVEMGQSAVSRIFSFMQTLEESATKKSKAGFNRLAASTYDRDAWINIITRIATRAPVGLETISLGVKQESELNQGKRQQIPISDTIRESLYNYVLEDFRKRVDIAVSWLVEEWYVEKCQLRAGKEIIPHYEKWALRILDGVMPYLDARDKFLTRFLSEIPELSAVMLERVKGLCRDPAMVNLAVTSLLYLVMMKPPARQIALDAVENIWRTYDDAKPMAAKYLAKWRPGFLEQNSNTKKIEDSVRVQLNTPQNIASVST